MGFRVQNISHLLDVKNKLHNTTLFFQIDGKKYEIKPSDYLIIFKTILPKSVLEKQMKGLVLVDKYNEITTMKPKEVKNVEPKYEVINTANKNNFIKDELFVEDMDTELEDLLDTQKDKKNKKK
jgi:hypothetical protein